MRSLLVTGLALVLSSAAFAAPAKVKVLGAGRDTQGDWLGYGLARGEIVDGLRWSDANGENAVILSVRELPGSGTQTKILFVARYVHEPGAIRVAQSAYRIVEECPEDAVLGGNVIGVYDEDRDGTGELAFTIESACVSDVSPVGVELHVWENGSDWSLDGQSVVCDDLDCRDRVGGEIDAVRFDGAAPQHLSLAKRLWQLAVEKRSRH